MHAERSGNEGLRNKAELRKRTEAIFFCNNQQLQSSSKTTYNNLCFKKPDSFGKG